MRRLLGIRLSNQSQSQPISDITEGETGGSWTSLGPGKDILFPELERLYWEGVKGELENIIKTLEIWQRPEFSHIKVEDEEDTFVHGFDTFIDQVTKESREFAIRYGELKEAKEPDNRKADRTQYSNFLNETFKDRQTEYNSTKLRSGVRCAIEKLPILEGIRQRAWTLLQATGVLDIEKLIEHRPPLDSLGFWKRPAIPQLALAEFDELSIPKLKSLRCLQANCRDVIRGSMFTSSNKDLPSVICENCYRSEYYGNSAFVKAYKHCILADTVTPPISRRMCHCKTVPHFDSSGKALALFPVDKDTKHTNVDGTGTMQCTLLKLAEIVAIAKYKGLQSIVGTEKVSRQRTLSSRLASEKEPKEDPNGEKNKTRWNMKQPTTRTANSLHDSTTREAVSSSTSVATEATADTDIPLFFRKFATKYPFGNVHMALRVGPLVIENGVARTKGGALVTLRERPVFHDRPILGTARSRSIAVEDSPSREVWQRIMPPSQVHKRYKAVMKQVVGVPFTGTLGREVELEIVDDLVAAIHCPFNDPGLSATDQQTILDSALNPILEKLRKLIGSRVKAYLHSIVERLLDPVVKLAWSATGNNCQTFCNSLIDPVLFQPLVNGPHSFPDKPLYVMSFVCPEKGYLQRGVNTKYDVPSGLTEEYLLRFHFGRHDEADVIDMNQEYWYDWGAFGGPLYKYQDLFPWDCTEAYGRYPTQCGSCNLAKHVWAFPFDSWSMTSLHLIRDRHMYAPATVDTSISASGRGSTPQSWMRNRLTVLAAITALSRAAVAMAATPAFGRATAWLHEDSGLGKDNPALMRVKLGGIHRAQPFSHYFEAGTYSHYFLAEWALRPRREQVAAYEELRDGRVRLPDVVRGTGRRFATREPEERDARGFGGFGGFNSFSGFGSHGGTSVAAAQNMNATLEIHGSFLSADAGLSCTNDSSSTAEASGPACVAVDGSNCSTGCGKSTCGGFAGGDGGGGGFGGGGFGGGGCGGGGGGGGGCGGGGGGGGGGF